MQLLVDNYKRATNTHLAEGEGHHRAGAQISDANLPEYEYKKGFQRIRSSRGALPYAGGFCPVPAGLTLTSLDVRSDEVK